MAKIPIVTPASESKVLSLFTLRAFMANLKLSSMSFKTFNSYSLLGTKMIKSKITYIFKNKSLDLRTSKIF